MNVLIESDILVNTLPSTPHTAYMLTHDLFREASKSRGSRPGPLFINIGRGDVISTSDLLACLENDSTTEEITQDHQPCLSHAVLDVVEEEPLPSSSPIWSHPQISITPHISAISTPELVLGVFTDNLIRFLEIKEEHQQDGHEELNKELRQGLKYVVDQSKGY
jgi:phosphoglycerate dehydrogenase-like enzyme